MDQTKDKARQRAEQDKRLKEKMAQIKHKIIVMSGKGGVGKSTIAVNLASGLALKGYRVGILDIDIHGPNIAKMFKLEDKQLIGSDLGIEPVNVFSDLSLKAISLAFLFKDKDKAVIWRGPLKMITIKQFLADVNWGKLDYLIIDSPPGTGDEPLSACQLIPGLDGAVIVTTPQDVAILDARKSINFVKELKLPVMGVVENMSGFICPHCKKEIDLFGKGGGEKSATELEVPFLGNIPLEPEFVKSGDSGAPFIYRHVGSQVSRRINKIIEKIISSLEKNKSLNIKL
ncbi:MAG: Mrp/NBP35 family ATP-binding protein [Candidatus Omnitrophota bacterium]